MSRLASCAVWFVGAAVPSVIVWYIVAYPLDRWSRGVGQDTWFLLHLYLSALGVAAALVAYSVVGFFRPRPSSVAAPFLAGIIFTSCQLLLGYLLRRAFPDRDVLDLELVGAVVLGAASAFVASPRAG